MHIRLSVGNEERRGVEALSRLRFDVTCAAFKGPPLPGPSSCIKAGLVGWTGAWVSGLLLPPPAGQMWLVLTCDATAVIETTSDIPPTHSLH